MDFHISEKLLSDKLALLKVKGRLDAVAAPDLKSKLKELVAGSHVKVIIDLTDVSFIDSSGSAALVSGFRAAREAGGTIKLAGLREQTMMVFKLTRLDRVFEIHSDVEAAISSESGHE